MPIKNELSSLVEEMPDEEENVSYAEDGTRVTRRGDLIEVDMEGEEDTEGTPGPAEFDDNLAEHLSESERVTLGQTLKEYLEIDLQSRAEWERRLSDGMEIIGLKDIPEDSTAFEGAASVTHPGLAEAIVQFQARAMEEFMPPEGPVKCGVFGKSNDELEDQAKRVEDYMNFQLTEEDDEYYWETDNLLFYLPYAGSAFKKVAIDPATGRTRSRFVTAKDFIVPYFATSLKTAPRYTHMYSMSRNTFLRAVARKYFVETTFDEASKDQRSTVERRELEDKADLRTPSFHEDDEVYTFCEMSIEYEFDWETEGGTQKFKKPYVITFEYESGKVVGIRRLWDQDSDACEKDVWFVHYKYLPGFGFYGFGLLHLIGSLGRAAGGALRALLDGSTTSSLSGGFKSKDARISGDTRFSAGVWKDVDMTADELSKSFYTPPFKEPTPALFKTFEIIVGGMQRFASTTENMVGDASNTGPVGTTVALIEQGSKIFSGIHKRMHRSAATEFRLIAKSNYRYMDVMEYPYEVEGAGRTVMKEDFSDRVDIRPISDPNIFSSVQRIALAQATLELIKSAPDMYNKEATRKAHRSMLKALKVPDADDYLPEEDLKRIDPISENQAFTVGVAAKAFIDQDHDSHMTLHQNYLQEIEGTGDQDMINMIVPRIKAHMAEHFGMSYRLRAQAVLSQSTGAPLPSYDPEDTTDYEELPIDIENTISQVIAANMEPPQPPPAPPSEEDGKDMKAQREADRKDMLAQRDSDRKDAQLKAQLTRDGVIPDDLTDEQGAGNLS